MFLPPVAIAYSSCFKRFVACQPALAWVLFGPTFTLVLSHFLMPGQPRNWFAWEPAAARALFHFGGWVFVSTTGLATNSAKSSLFTSVWAT